MRCICRRHTTLTESWPILYIFEPAARSQLALNRFKLAADRMNWILACSNNSRNGPWEDILAAADAVLLDTQEKLSIDYKQIYTTGFSGGSRAALGIAVITGSVAGVIGCGAVFPSVKEYLPGPENAKFLYVGMVGLKDMNYLEHHNARQRLHDSGIDNHLILFDAGHEWPPSEKILQAAQWLELKRQVKSKEVEKTLLKEYEEAVLAEADTFLQQNYPVMAVNSLQNYTADFDPFTDIGLLEERIQKISSEKLYEKRRKAYQKSEEREAASLEKYLSAFVELYWTATGTEIPADQAEWWQTQINFLQKQSQLRDPVKRDQAYRMLNLISARSAESSFRFVGQGNYQLAIALNELWLKAQPKDVYANWHLAKVMATTGNKEGALEHLEKALKYGMQYKRSLTIPEFEILKEEARFKKVLQALEGSE